MPPLLDALALRARGGHFCALVIRAGVELLRLARCCGLPVYSQRDVRAPLLGGGLVRAGCELLSARFQHVTRLMRVVKSQINTKAPAG